MNLFLHIKVIEDPLSISKPLSIENCTYSDIDNYSSPEVLAVVNRAIKEANQLLVYYEIAGEHELGKLLQVFNSTLSFQGNKKVVHCGKHQQLSRLLPKVNSNEVVSSDVMDLAKDFFT